MCPESLLIQPGLPIKHAEGMPGTLGAYALTTKGFVTIVSTGHTLTNLWRAKVGDPILVYPVGLDIRKAASGVVWTPRIRGIAEDIPVVLKEPIEPRIGMKVIKSGWRTSVTTGEVINIEGEATVAYRDGSKKHFTDLGIAQIEADHGDSGSILFSLSEYQPVGMILAKAIKYTNIVYFTKLINIPQLQGIFSPISIPSDSIGIHREIINSLVPDGLFMQKSNLTAKGINEVMDALGATVPNESNVNPQINNISHCTDKKVRVGETIHSYDGRVAFTEKGEILGIIFAGSKTHQVIMPVDRIMSALDLELVKYNKERLVSRISRESVFSLRKFLKKILMHARKISNRT